MKHVATRDYDSIADELRRVPAEARFHVDAARQRAASVPSGRDATMRRVVDALWNHLRGCGVSWIGFYIDQPERANDRRMVLGPCRDKPACSPIGLHGVCGQALLSKQVRIVRDVRDLGDNYIACDPRDRSEIVIPLLDEAGACWGVLDVDSHEVGSFDASDDAGLRKVLRASCLLK